MLQQVLKQVSKKRSKHARSTSHSKDKENSDLDSSVRSHSPHEQKDKVQPYSGSDNQSITEPESKANNDDIAQRIKQLEEQVAAMRTNSIQQSAEELVACAKTGGKNKQSKLNKAQFKRNKKSFAKEEMMAANDTPGTSSQPTGGGPTNRPHTKYLFKEDLVESLFEVLYMAKK